MNSQVADDHASDDGDVSYYSSERDDLSDSDSELSDSREVNRKIWGEKYKTGIARVPLVLLESIAAALRVTAPGRQSDCLQRAWMRAIAQHFPDTPLGQLRAADRSLLPPWIMKGIINFETFKVRANTCTAGGPFLFGTVELSQGFQPDNRLAYHGSTFSLFLVNNQLKGA